MDWSNWVYLLFGLGLGVGGSWLLRSQSSMPESNEPVSPEVTAANQDVPALLEELKQTKLAYAMASEMSRFKGGFLARTSHELRSPLNGIIGAYQLILAELCDDLDEEREFLAQAHESALKLLGLLDSILVVAKTEHGSDRMQIQPLQLVAILNDVKDLTHLPAENRNLRLKVTLPDPDIYILADAPRLTQVLVYLVDNAITEMQHGSIGISAHASPASGVAHIWIDTPLPATSDKGVCLGWNEPLDSVPLVPATEGDFSANFDLSTGMKLLMNQNLLEMMSGRLEVVAPPESSSETSNLIRIQCSLPLVIPEPEFD
ncbi:sensor histidine kinase [Microcoleus sp. FACHB-672]|uniref:sensor histidine kinase n=1 Tax=Microcoleus sp. FACHB-672 TaxID=2692825 RepID=UPI0016864235|nr:HAMP domain-containing sensor histidine kinase [Microcoleus sp. FACHB-672]MBD2039194.1 HAMP domain-containing histidine kinase [Microcoleus sp. FACHB-672]